MNLPKLLIALGLILTGAGIALWLLLKIPGFDRLGQLPGDIRIEKNGFRFYFPWVTSILVSVLLTLLFQFIGRFKK